MKNNYKMTMSFDGSRYYGWEHQPGKETIQGKIEEVLARMCEVPKESLEVIGAGRTDAGVHARGMVASVVLDTAMTPDEIRAYMNRYLPEDISINDVRIASERFHARYQAVGKTYCYTCYYGETKPVFDRRYTYVLEKDVDVERMKEAAALLVGRHDFRSFCGNPRMKKSTMGEIYEITIRQKSGFLYLTYHGAGFLQYMVRILTGTLLEVGEGKRTPESMTQVLEALDRKAAGLTAPARGLCLIRVDY